MALTQKDKYHTISILQERIISMGVVHFLDNGGEIPHAGLTPNFPLENVSEQKEWNAGRLLLIE